MTTSKMGFIALAVLCTASLAYGQSQTQTEETLTLTDATARALARNLDIRIDRETVNIAEAREVSAEGSYDFRLRADGTERYQLAPNVTLFSGAPPGDLAPWQNNFSGSASLSRLFKSGATVTAATSVSRDTTNSFFTLFTPAYITSLGLQIRQPLLRNRETDPARTQLKIAALDTPEEPRHAAAAGAEHRLAAWSRATGRWWRRGGKWTCAAIASRSPNGSEPTRRRASTRGRRRRSTSRSRRRKSSGAAATILAAQEQAVRAERNLKLLMTDDPADPIWSLTLVPTNPPEVEARPVDIQKALADAMRLRPELDGRRAGRVGGRSADGAGEGRAASASGHRGGIHRSWPRRHPQSPNGGVSRSDRAFPRTARRRAGGLVSGVGAAALPGCVDRRVGGRAARQACGKGRLRRGAVRSSGRRRSGCRRRATASSVDVLDSATALETAGSRMQAARAGLEAANDAAAGRAGSVHRRHEHEFPRAHAPERPRAGSADGDLGGDASTGAR